MLEKIRIISPWYDREFSTINGLVRFLTKQKHCIFMFSSECPVESGYITRRCYYTEDAGGMIFYPHWVTLQQIVDIEKIVQCLYNIALESCEIPF